MATLKKTTETSKPTETITGGLCNPAEIEEKRDDDIEIGERTYNCLNANFVLYESESAIYVRNLNDIGDFDWKWYKGDSEIRNEFHSVRCRPLKSAEGVWYLAYYPDGIPKGTFKKPATKGTRTTPEGSYNPVVSKGSKGMETAVRRELAAKFMCVLLADPSACDCAKNAVALADSLLKELEK